MQGERKLVDGLRDRAAYVAGYSGEMPRSLQPLAVKGEWKVVSRSGLSDIARGDEVEITEDGEFITTRQRGEDVTQPVQVNERQLRLADVGLVFNYKIKGDRLALVSEDGMSELVLRRNTID
jgi:Ca-activated chloride channel family protein